jgi:ribonuclease E
MVVGDPHRPAPVRSGAAEGDVAAEAHQGPGAGRVMDLPGGPVGREGLRRGAEVERDAVGHGDGAGGPVDADRPPSRHGGDPHHDAGPGLAHEGEVAVVAELAHRAADRRVDVAAGDARRAQGDLEGLDQQGPDGGLTAAGAVDAAEVGVVAEAAAGAVHPREARAQQALGLTDGVRPGDGDERRRAERRERGGGGGGDHQEPPEPAAGAAEDPVGALGGAPSVPQSSCGTESCVASAGVAVGAAVSTADASGGDPPSDPVAASPPTASVPATATAAMPRVSRETERAVASRSSGGGGAGRSPSGGSTGAFRRRAAGPASRVAREGGRNPGAGCEAAESPRLRGPCDGAVRVL